MIWPFLFTAVLAAPAPNADSACAVEREFVRRNFNATYVDPVRAVYDRLFNLMPGEKKAEADQLRARLAEAERRLAATKAADPKMTDILTHGETGRRAFDTMRAVKSEQRRYATEIGELKHKLNVIVTDYLVHNLEYLRGLSAEAAKSGVDVTIDLRKWDVKLLAAAKAVSAPKGDEAGQRVSLSFWTLGGQPQVELVGSDRAREVAGNGPFAVDAYIDHVLSARCRATPLAPSVANYFDHHGPYRGENGAAVIKSGAESAQ